MFKRPTINKSIMINIFTFKMEVESEFSRKARVHFELDCCPGSECMLEDQDGG